MTTIRQPSPHAMLGKALVLPAGPAGGGHGRPGDATRGGLWRSRAAGPASLAGRARRRGQGP